MFRSKPLNWELAKSAELKSLFTKAQKIFRKRPRNSENYGKKKLWTWNTWRRMSQTSRACQKWEEKGHQRERSTLKSVGKIWRSLVSLAIAAGGKENKTIPSARGAERGEGRDVTWLERSSRGNAGIARSQWLLGHSLGAQSGGGDGMDSGNRNASWQISEQALSLKHSIRWGWLNYFQGFWKN